MGSAWKVEESRSLGSLLDSGERAKMATREKRGVMVAGKEKKMLANGRTIALVYFYPLFAPPRVAVGLLLHQVTPVRPKSTATATSPAALGYVPIRTQSRPLTLSKSQLPSL